MKRERANNAERDMLRHLAADGWECFTRGWPDILAVKGNRLRLIEVKPAPRAGRPPQGLRKHQKQMADILESFLGVKVELKIVQARGVTPRRQPKACSEEV